MTNKTSKATEKKALQRAIAIAGGRGKLARTLGISTQAVQQWEERGRVSCRHLRAVYTLTGVPRDELRTDL